MIEQKKFDLLVSYKEVGRPVSDKELRDSFYSYVSEAMHEGVSEESELDRERYMIEESILSSVSPIIRSMIC